MKVCQTVECLDCKEKCYDKPKGIRLVVSNRWVRKVTVRDLAHRDIFVVSSKGSVLD